jgi:potassium-transporting ATPase KdpC subunit
MIKVAIRALIATIVLAVLTGLVYPLAITAIAQLGYSGKADGSLVSVDGKVVGSSMIGQLWKGDQWFYGRPSAIGYDASTSSGTNLGPNSTPLAKQIADTAAGILKQEGQYTPGLTVASIPPDLLTSSASGLDPDISEAAAMFQVPRIAAVRGLPVSQVRALVLSKVLPPDLGFLGQSRVNVLALNIALSQLSQSHA